MGRRALLISYEPSHFVELSRVARLLAASGTWEPVLYFAKRHADTPSRIATCRAEGWTVYGEAAGEGGDTAAPKPSLLRFVPAPIKRLGDGPWRYRAYRNVLRAAFAHATTVLAETQAALVVLPEDNLEHLTSVMVKAAAARGVPTVIVPFTVANHLEPAEAYLGNPAYVLGAFGRALFAAYPQWVIQHRGSWLVRMTVPEALSIQHMGFAPPQPWILNSGYADAIAVESEAMLAHYRACKLPADQLVVTGALYDDILAAAARDVDRTKRELGLDERPVVLCALPPDQIATRPPGVVEFATHAELARAWIETLCARRDMQVVVNLHPRTPAEGMQFLESLGARIARVDVARLIPTCDVYVASASATIRMAIACGKPVINYDVYRYGYTDYDGVPSVYTMTALDAFRAAVTQLADPAARAAATAQQRAVMRRWGNLDGHAGERMLALFDRLATR